MKEELRKLPHIRINRPKELALRVGTRLEILEEVAQNMRVHCYPFNKVIGKKARELCDVSESLRAIHRRIDTHILNRFAFPPEFQGGIPGRSLRTNAVKHIGKGNVGNFDLKEFFPSVNTARVRAAFRRLGCAPDVAQLLSELTTYNDKLPQGFATSPKIAALVLIPMSQRLQTFLKPFGAPLTIWIDDLTISTAYPIKKLKPTIRRIAYESGFQIHKDENTPTYRNARQTVTGSVVNTKISVPKEFRLPIMRAVHLCEKEGIRTFWRREVKGKAPLREYVDLIRGKISSMVAIDATKYEPLQQRWERLTSKEGFQGPRGHRVSTTTKKP